jgi:hypothetical protein
VKAATAGLAGSAATEGMGAPADWAGSGVRAAPDGLAGSGAMEGRGETAEPLAGSLEGLRADSMVRKARTER